MIEATSCGGVVIFRGKILLLYKNYKNKYEGWVLPKGTVEEGEEFNEESYFPEYDEAGYNNPDSMKEERAEAVKAMMADIIEKVENDELKEEDMQTFLENVCTDEELEALGEDYEFEELVAMYCEIRKRFVDDDGEEHEPGDPYELNEKNFCCGHELKYEKKSKTFICESCGEKYTAE